MNMKAIQDYVLRKDQNHLAQNKINIAMKLKRWGMLLQLPEVWGVEINPEAKREDIYIGSFDELPTEWEGKFSIVFSNSFDHSEDPVKVINEWKRVCQDGAYLILAFTPSKKVSKSDPLGGMDFQEIRKLVNETVVFYSETGGVAGYYEICFRINK